MTKVRVGKLLTCLQSTSYWRSRQQRDVVRENGWASMFCDSDIMNFNGDRLVWVSICLSVHLSYHSILVPLGSNGLHHWAQNLARGCQHGRPSVHNSLAALRAPTSLTAIDLESVEHRANLMFSFFCFCTNIWTQNYSLSIIRVFSFVKLCWKAQTLERQSARRSERSQGSSGSVPGTSCCPPRQKRAHCPAVLP